MPSRVKYSLVSGVLGEFNLAIEMFSKKEQVRVKSYQGIENCCLRLCEEQESALAWVETA